VVVPQLSRLMSKPLMLCLADCFVAAHLPKPPLIQPSRLPCLQQPSCKALREDIWLLVKVTVMVVRVPVSTSSNSSALTLQPFLTLAQQVTF
jgi:hypothetical protein